MADKHIIRIEGAIGKLYDYFTDDIPNTTAQAINKILDNISGDIEVHINSMGGDVFEGLAILAALTEYDKGQKTAIVNGYCASAATLPLFAMDNVKSHESAMFCFHKSATVAFGHATDLRKAAEDLDKIDGSVVDLYMKRFKGTEEELHALLDEDRLMSAKEALELGFVDELVAVKKDDEDVEGRDKEDEDDDKEKKQETHMSLLDAFNMAKEVIKEEETVMEHSFLANFKK